MRRRGLPQPLLLAPDWRESPPSAHTPHGAAVRVGGGCSQSFNPGPPGSCLPVGNQDAGNDAGQAEKEGCRDRLREQ